MKKATIYGAVISSVTAMLVMSGCVDKDYDLKNMDRNEITVGNVITTPPIIVKLPFEGIAGGLSAVEQLLADNGITMEDLGIVPMDIDADYSVTLPLETPLLSGDILEYFDTDEGSVTLLLDVENSLRMQFDLQLEFCDAAGQTIVALDTFSIDAASENTPSLQNSRMDVTSVLSRLDQIYQVNVTMNRLDIQKIVVSLDDYLLMNIRLEKTGGIKLYTDEQ